MEGGSHFPGASALGVPVSGAAYKGPSSDPNRPRAAGRGHHVLTGAGGAPSTPDHYILNNGQQVGVGHWFPYQLYQYPQQLIPMGPVGQHQAIPQIQPQLHPQMVPVPMPGWQLAQPLAQPPAPRQAQQDGQQETSRKSQEEAQQPVSRSDSPVGYANSPSYGDEWVTRHQYGWSAGQGSPSLGKSGEQAAPTAEGRGNDHPAQSASGRWGSVMGGGPRDTNQQAAQNATPPLHGLELLGSTPPPSPDRHLVARASVGSSPPLAPRFQREEPTWPVTPPPRAPAQERGVFSGPTVREGIRQVILAKSGTGRVIVRCVNDRRQNRSFRVSTIMMQREASNWMTLRNHNFTATFDVQRPAGVRALAYILHIIHKVDVLQAVPEQLPVVTLGYIAAFISTLGCQSSLQLWIHRWLTSFRDYYVATNLIGRRDHGWLLYLAIEFGDRKLFASVAESIQAHHEIDEDGDFLYESGEKLLVRIPVDLGVHTVVKTCLEDIKKCRGETVQAILDRVSLFVRRITDTDTKQPCEEEDRAWDARRTSAGDSQMCHAVSYGILIHGLSERCLWPLPDGETMRWSIQHLQGRLHEVLQGPCDNWVPERHRGCLPSRFMGELTDVLRAVRIPNLQEDVGNSSYSFF